MITVRIFIYCLAIAISLQANGNIASSNKPIAKFVAVENPGFTNKDGTGLYWEIIDAVFSDQFQVIKTTASQNKAHNMVNGGLAFAMVGLTEENKNNLILSTHHIDRSYATYALYKDRNIVLHDLSSLKNFKVAIKKHSLLQNLLPKSTYQYTLDSIYQADKLTLNNKVDIVLVNSYDLHLASPKGQLISQEILPAQKRLLAFANNPMGKRWQKIFDRKMAAAINSNKLVTIFDNVLGYQHANYQNLNIKSSINWNLPPKLFNHKTQRLEVLNRELIFSQYVVSQLPEFHFNFIELSEKIFNNQLSYTQTHCALSIAKAENEINRLSSAPIHAFIKPRLFFLNQSDSEVFGQYLSENNEVDLVELINKYDEISIAISKNSRIYNDLIKIVPKETMRKLYLVDDLNYKSLVDLLMAKRINAVIIWPSMMAELLNDQQALKKLHSKAIKQAIGDNIFSKVVCSNTNEGKKVTNKINELLHSPIHQHLLHQGSLEQLDPASKIEYKKLLELSIE